MMEKQTEKEVEILYIVIHTGTLEEQKSLFCYVNHQVSGSAGRQNLPVQALWRSKILILLCKSPG